MKKYPRFTLAILGTLLLTLISYHFPAKEMSRIDFVIYINGTIWGLLILLGWPMIKYLSEVKISESNPAKSLEKPVAPTSTAVKVSKEFSKALSRTIAIMVTLIAFIPLWICAEIAVNVTASLLLEIYHLIQLASFF